MPFRNIHRWFGRFLLAFAIINGGLGLEFAANTPGGEKTYGVVAGIVGLTYLITLIVWYVGKGKEEKELA
jgi:hypothetical protein